MSTLGAGGTRAALVLGPALALVLGACGGGLRLRIELVTPAVIPVHVFPLVFLRGDGGPDAETLATAIVRDLRAHDIDALEIAPGSRAMEHLSSGDGAALIVAVRVTRSQTTEVRRYTDMTPLCAPGCSAVPVERLTDVTVLHGTVELVMLDARTEEAFARERIERDEDDLDMGAGGRLTDRLTQATLALFRVTRSTRDVGLSPLRSPEGARALEDARGGRIESALTALRTLAEHAAELPLEERVAIHYDLGQVLRVAALDGDGELEVEARAALEEAMHLSPDARIGAALEALGEEAALRARAREEDLAYRRNREPGLPPPPSTYE